MRPHTSFRLLSWQCHLPGNQPPVITKRYPGRWESLSENLRRCCSSTHQEANGWGNGTDIHSITGEQSYFQTRVDTAGMPVPTLV